jgi:predicted hotdog family 3-hydroxylacyl-ACP dehydratase
MDYQNLDIENLIPQRRPFVMIDKVLGVSQKMFETTFLIKEDNIFNEEGKFSIYGLIENIAQTCAIGLNLTLADNTNPDKDGFIAAISKTTVLNLPSVGDSIRTEVVLMHRFESMFLLKGENFKGINKLMECEIKLVAK